MNFTRNIKRKQQEQTLNLYSTWINWNTEFEDKFEKGKETNESFSLNFLKTDNFIQQKSRKIRVKTDEENEFLEDMFIKDPLWTRKTVQICKKALNLTTPQVYKWGFDK